MDSRRRADQRRRPSELALDERRRLDERERPKTDGPDFELLGQMIEAFPDVPVLCEGRIHTPDQLHQVMAAGAWAAVVGTAITHPTTITRWFEAKL